MNGVLFDSYSDIKPRLLNPQRKSTSTGKQIYCHWSARGFYHTMSIGNRVIPEGRCVYRSSPEYLGIF
jgi:hypothetical protein